MVCLSSTRKELFCASDLSNPDPCSPKRDDYASNIAVLHDSPVKCYDQNYFRLGLICDLIFNSILILMFVNDCDI
jgi:hypothetical protein